VGDFARRDLAPIGLTCISRLICLSLQDTVTDEGFRLSDRGGLTNVVTLGSVNVRTAKRSDDDGGMKGGGGV
jgi:hypothetical protein